MDFLSKLVAFFSAIGALLQPAHLPSNESQDWKIAKQWQAEGNRWVLEASSQAMVDQCKTSPHSHIQFPAVDQSAHEIYVDNRLVETFGDPTFQSVRSYYGAPNISCSKVMQATEIRWRVYAYAKILAFLRRYPEVVAGESHYNVIAESLNAIVAGSLLVMGLFTLVVFFGKLSIELSASLAGSCLFLALYFGGTATSTLGISVPMFPLHRMTETCVWLGLLLYFYALHLHGFRGSWIVVRFGFPIIGLGLIWILLARDGDNIQIGSVIPMFPAIVMGIAMIAPKVQDLIRDGVTRRRLFEVLSLTCFLALAAHDALSVNGIIRGYMLMGVGMVAGLFFFAMSVNEKINHTYKERDYLRAHLEEEVQIKTKELRKKTVALEDAMRELKEAQAELVQSARLASLGTLSAGIAHEINNSLNYVYGSLKPMEKLVADHPDEEKRGKILKLITLMNDGLKLTFEIIKSLRNYTGLNQAKFNDLNVKDIVESVLTLLRSKIADNVKVEIQIPAELTVFGSVVGLNQVLMNLITNAVGAMPAGGILCVSGELAGERVKIRVSDTGQGITKEIQERIFEPFFTTKEVGKGSGLGLYIVKREVERHQGQITIESTPGQGTVFTLVLPAHEKSHERKEVA